MKISYIFKQQFTLKLTFVITSKFPDQEPQCHVIDKFSNLKNLIALQSHWQIFTFKFIIQMQHFIFSECKV